MMMNQNHQLEKSKRIENLIIADDLVTENYHIFNSILKLDNIKVIGIFKNKRELLEFAQEKKANILIINSKIIDFGDIAIIELLKNLKVIVTSDSELFAIKAFDFGVIDFIVNPINIKRILAALNKAYESKSNSDIAGNLSNNLLAVKHKKSSLLIPLDDIVFIRNKNRKTFIHTTTRVFESSTTIKEIEKKLTGMKFFKIHRQHIINLNFIRHIKVLKGNKFYAYLKSTEVQELPISRTYIQQLKKILGISIKQ